MKYEIELYDSIKRRFLEVSEEKVEYVVFLSKIAFQVI